MNYIRPLYYHWPVTFGKDRPRSLGIILLTIGVFLAGLFIVARLERRAEERGGGESVDDELRTSEGVDSRAIQMVDTPAEIEDGGDDPAGDRDGATRLVPLSGPTIGAVERWAAGLNGATPHFARSGIDDSALSILLLDGEIREGIEGIDREAVRIARGDAATDESAASATLTAPVPPFVMDAVIAEITSRGAVDAVYRVVTDDPSDRESEAVREYVLLFSPDASLLLRLYVEEDEIFDVEISPAE